MGALSIVTRGIISSGGSQVVTVTQFVPVAPAPVTAVAQVTSLNPTDVSSTTNCKGVFQGDIIIRTALIEGMRDIRRQPWLLDYAFASLAQDDLTKSVYGLAQ